jgi:hypothetical protein
MYNAGIVHIYQQIEVNFVFKSWLAYMYAGFV